MLLITHDKIRTFQRKLYRKAKLEPSYRFYALYDKICRYDILEHAYKRVRRNGGSPGIDGVDFQDIKEIIGIDKFLCELSSELKERRYQPQAVKRVMIPNGNGEKRPLGIPTIRDRVVQMATKIVIEPVFEADFMDHSYGFRPRRGAHDALKAISQSLLRGRTKVLDADLSKYFDTIPHSKLMRVVAERIADRNVLSLLQMWLKAPVISIEKDGKKRIIGGGKNNSLGTPQGGVISPLMSNLYLHLLDRIWVRNRLEERFGTTIIRYADDFVVLCSRGTQRAKAVVKRVLERLGLTLNEAKTHEVDACRESFKFLGFNIRMLKSKRTGKFYPHVEPSEKAIKKVKTHIKSLTGRKLTSVPIETLIKEINQVVRGWIGYFYFGNSTRVLSKIKYYVEQRLLKHLRKRHKIRSWSRTAARFTYVRLSTF